MKKSGINSGSLAVKKREVTDKVTEVSTLKAFSSIIHFHSKKQIHSLMGPKRFPVLVQLGIKWQISDCISG